jgi:hypothetical protein
MERVMRILLMCIRDGRGKKVGDTCWRTVRKPGPENFLLRGSHQM